MHHDKAILEQVFSYNVTFITCQLLLLNLCTFFPSKGIWERPEESDVDEVIDPTSDTESEPEETCTEVAPEEENADDANTTQMTEQIDAHSSVLDPAAV